jgi:hypothetical protein
LSGISELLELTSMLHEKMKIIVQIVKGVEKELYHIRSGVAKDSQ